MLFNYMEPSYMGNEKIDPPQSLGKLLNFATGACNAVCQTVLEPHDLSLPQWVILSALWRQSDLTVGELAAYTGNNAPAASRIVDRMIEKGLLLRAPDEHDRRTVRIRLADKGEKLRHLAGFYEDINAILLDGFSAKEADLMFSLIKRADANARQWKVGPGERR